MTFLEKIDQDLKQAMLAKDRQRLDVLRFLKSAIEYAAIEKPRAALSDADVMQVIQKQIKQRRESIEQFKQGGRAELAAKEATELALLETYLPKQMSDSELSSLIQALVKETGASGKKDFGRVMKACTEKLAGRADNKRISEILGKLLG
jgi:uncharacterized protein YqeY